MRALILPCEQRLDSTFIHQSLLELNCLFNAILKIDMLIFSLQVLLMNYSIMIDNETIITNSF